MHLLLFVAGAAEMYCGSCLRDHALARALIRRGHTVTLLPLYTPARTDEPSASEDRVFFGGISVYLEQQLPFYRRAPAWVHRLLDRPGLIAAVARRSIRTDPAVLGELTLSVLRGADGNQEREFEKLIAWLRSQPPADAINLPNALLISMAAPLARALDRPVCCTLQGEDLFLEGLKEPYRSAALDSIRAQIGNVDLFIAVSDYYASFMSRYLRIPPEKIRVVPLGVSVNDVRTTDPVRSPIPTIGYLARIAPEKGLHRLAAAYRRLRESNRLPAGRLEAAGYLAADRRAYLEDIERRLAGAGLGAEFRYHGEVDRAGKLAFLQRLDVFSVPAPYHDPKGLFLLEAMACGVPVVQPATGAFVEMIGRTGGGILVEPDDDEALADGLWQVLSDPARAKALGAHGAHGVRMHYSLDAMAARAEAVYKELVAASS